MYLPKSAIERTSGIQIYEVSGLYIYIGSLQRRCNIVFLELEGLEGVFSRLQLGNLNVITVLVITFICGKCPNERKS